MSVNHRNLFRLGTAETPTPQAIEWCAPAIQTPATLRYTLDWLQLIARVPNANGVRELDFTVNLDLSQYKGQMQQVKGVYIDNRGCPFRVTVECDDTGHSAVCDPDSVGFYPLFTSNFTFSIARVRPEPVLFRNTLAWRNEFAASETRLFFVNTSIPASDNRAISDVRVVNPVASRGDFRASSAIINAPSGGQSVTNTLFTNSSNAPVRVGYITTTYYQIRQSADATFRPQGIALGLYYAPNASNANSAYVRHAIAGNNQSDQIMQIINGPYPIMIEPNQTLYIGLTVTVAAANMQYGYTGVVTIV